MATSDGPISINTVTLTVVDLQQMVEFYEDSVGLNVISTNGQTCALGQGDKPLLYLRQDRNAQRYRKAAGLFHTAFLLPERGDLGSWLNYAAENHIRLDGSADHLVSEALYLTDPEGNGIEIYVDRDRSLWNVENEHIEIGTIELNEVSLSKAAATEWNGFPIGSVIGHVHLQVGNVALADDFYRDKLGFARTAHLPGASFYGSGGYHHQLAANVWSSEGARKRRDDTTGLYELEFAVSDDDFKYDELEDPWGMRLRFTKM